MTTKICGCNQVYFVLWCFCSLIWFGEIWSKGRGKTSRGGMHFLFCLRFHHILGGTVFIKLEGRVARFDIFFQAQ